MVVEGMEGMEVEEELLQVGKLVERLVEWLEGKVVEEGKVGKELVVGIKFQVEELEGKVVEEGMVGMVLVVGRIELNWHCHHH